MALSIPQAGKKKQPVIPGQQQPQTLPQQRTKPPQQARPPLQTVKQDVPQQPRVTPSAPREQAPVSSAQPSLQLPSSGQMAGGFANIPVSGSGEARRNTRILEDRLAGGGEAIVNPYDQYAGGAPPPSGESGRTEVYTGPGGEDIEEPEMEVGAPSAMSNEAYDEQVRLLMQDLLRGEGMDVNTAEEEALIRELMQDRLGQGLVEQRARMGRAGFGSSGALAAIEGDVRRQAGQQAAQETLALRRQAEKEAIENALRSIGVDIDKRAEARQQMFDEEYLNVLRASLGMEPPAAEGGAGLPVPDTADLAQGAADLANRAIFNQGVEMETPQLAAVSDEYKQNQIESAVVSGQPPERGYIVEENVEKDGMLGDLYMDQSKTPAVFVFVPKASSTGRRGQRAREAGQ